MMHKACALNGVEAPLREQKVCSACQATVLKEDQVKMFRQPDGTWVALTDEEIKAQAGPKSKAVTIDAVIPLASLDPAWLTGEPDILGPVSAETQKPFALLRELLASRQLIAVGSYLSLTGADRVMTIRPEGNVLLAQDAYFPEERRDVELVVQPTVVSLSPKELDLGGQLIASLHKDSLIEALEGRPVPG